MIDPLEIQNGRKVYFYWFEASSTLKLDIGEPTGEDTYTKIDSLSIKIKKTTLQERSSLLENFILKHSLQGKFARAIIDRLSAVSFSK